jgi:hypothetical protein
MYYTASSYAIVELVPQKNGGMEVSRDEVALLTAADVLVAIADFIGQLILIYRCWLLWSKNLLVIILPTLTAITSLRKSWLQCSRADTR